ncbi:MAG: YfiR family protein [Acetobacteraceae bacterium]
MTRGATAWLRSAVALLLALVVARSAVGQDGQLELAVKATYLAKLSPFVAWPGEAAQFPGGVFAICVVGRDPFGVLLDRAVSGQTVAGRPVTVRRLETVATSPPCSLVYIAAGNAAALAAVQDQPILTVTDQTAEPQAKGIINFVIHDNRVRFEIDDAAAARSGLGISSKLLSLAVAVRPRSGPR